MNDEESPRASVQRLLPVGRGGDELHGTNGAAGGEAGRPDLRRVLHTLNPRRWKHSSRSADGRSDKSSQGDSQLSLEAVRPAYTGDGETTDGQLGTEVAGSSANTKPPDPVPSEVSRPPTKLSAAELDVSIEIWNNAYDQLKHANPGMVDIYEKILSSQLITSSIAQVTMNVTNRFVACGPEIRLARMKEVALRSLDKSQRHATVEKETVAAVALLKGLGDFIGGFIGVYPPAAMALSGVCAILPVLVMPLQANRDMAEGLEHIVRESDWYMALCRLLFREKWSDDLEFRQWRGVIKSRVTTLYEALLGFQMKCVCRCYHDHPVTAGIKVILGRLNWKDEAETVKGLEEAVKVDLQTYNSQVGVEFLCSIKSSSQELLNQLDKHFQDANHARIIRDREERQRYQHKLTGRFKTTPYDERMELNNVHVEGTSEWFCTHDKFRRWLGEDSGRVLLVSADPGCGKSVLARFLVKDVIPREKPDATVCYFFFKDNPEQSELSNAYSAFLHCLFYRNGGLADLCKNSIEKAGPALTEQPHSLWNIFTEALAYPYAGSVPRRAPRRAPNSNIEPYSFYDTSWDPSKDFDVRFLLTTRGYPTILDQLESLQPYCVRLSGDSASDVTAIQKEIDLVVSYRLNQLAVRRDFSRTQKEKVKTCLHRHGAKQRTYLWANLVFEVLEGAYPDNNDKWEALVNNLPQTVFAAYAKLLERVQPDQQDRVLTLLHIILVAYQPLSVQETNIALNVRDHPGEDSIDNLNMVSDKSFLNWIINTCGFFVTEHRGKIYLIHQTAKEFLLGTGDGSGKEHTGGTITSSLTKESWVPIVKLEAAHASMAESCISYLSLKTCRFGPIGKTVGEFVKEMRREYSCREGHSWRNLIALYPFTGYVIRFWPSHFRHSQRFRLGALSADIQARYWRHYTSIFEDFSTALHPGLLATLATQDVASLWNDPNTESNDSFIDLEYASYFTNHFGITQKSSGELEYSKFFSVAALAALWGHLRILQERIDPLTTTNKTSGPWDSWLRYLGITSWIDYGPTIPLDRLPIICAAAGRSIPCLEYLLSRQFPINWRDYRGDTPLHWAASRCYSDVVTYLLDHDANIDSTNHLGQTPLLLVLQSPGRVQGRESIARLLVSRRANVEVTNAAGDSPLHLAVNLFQDIRWYRRGWEVPRLEQIVSLASSKEELDRNFVKFLVDKGAAINAVNHSGQTPLIVACSKGVIYSVACLLHSGADHSIPSNIGLSPLLVSIPEIGLPRKDERLEIAKLLLRHGADTEAATGSGDRALHITCRQDCHTSAVLVSALLRHGADVSARGAHGLTPIRIAIRLRRGVEREEIITQLVAGGADPDERDELQRTALHWACLSRDSFLVRRLLDRNADLSARDADGNTPLHLVVTHAEVDWAEEPWIEKTIRLLLLNGASAMAQNGEDRTPVELVHHNGWAWLERVLPGFYFAGARSRQRSTGDGSASGSGGDSNSNDTDL